jgi:hypothetical protein
MRASLGMLGALVALGLSASNGGSWTITRHTVQPPPPTAPQTDQVAQSSKTPASCQRGGATVIGPSDVPLLAPGHGPGAGGAGYRGPRVPIELIDPGALACIPANDGTWSSGPWSGGGWGLPACPLVGSAPKASATPAPTAAPGCDPSIIGNWDGQPLNDGVLRWQ